MSFCLHFFVDREGQKLRIHNEPPGHIGDGESNNQKIATQKKSLKMETDVMKS